ncbi:hypothetical protein [Tenacibaculum halocynthiae]|uniref:hypothetical protein n=1 Tax=Tenacibaculum halocynthiae TaxID=1254437 RepID=UPI0038964846
MRKRILLIALIGISNLIMGQVSDTGDKVGIGITNPIFKLHISSPSNQLMRFTSTNGTWMDFESTNATIGNRIWSIGHFGTSGKFGVYQRDGTNQYRLTINHQGSVGIGTTNPDMKLSVYSDNKYISRFHSNETSDLMTGIRIGRKLSTGGGSYADLVNLSDGFGISAGYSGGNLPLNTQNTNHIAIYTNFSTRNIGIGTTTPGIWKLAVNGNIRAKEIKVETGWSDFVFYDDYKLPTLKEVEKHIKEKGHLKDIPSAKDVEKNGIFLGKMDSKLLQKIEELTLYTIQQQKEIEELKLQNKILLELQKRLEKLEKK